MPRRDAYLTVDEKPDRMPSFILLGSKGYQCDKAATGIKQAFDAFRRGGTNATGVVGSDEAGSGVEKRPLEVETRHQATGEFVGLAKADQFSELGLEGLDFIRDEGNENTIHSIVGQSATCVMELFGIEG